MMRRVLTALLITLWLPAALLAQAGPPGNDPFARYLFPPERVIGHAQEIGLEEGQRNAIRKEVQKAQPKFLDLQFDLQAEIEKLTGLLQEKPVEEAKVLAQVDRVLALEREVKRTQISLLVRIKNLLTPSQQAKLAEFQKEGEQMGPRPIGK